MEEPSSFEKYFIKSKSKEYGIQESLVRERWEDFQEINKTKRHKHTFKSFDEFLIITKTAVKYNA